MDVPLGKLTPSNFNPGESSCPSENVAPAGSIISLIYRYYFANYADSDESVGVTKAAHARRDVSLNMYPDEVSEENGPRAATKSKFIDELGTGATDVASRPGRQKDKHLACKHVSCSSIHFPATV